MWRLIFMKKKTTEEFVTEAKKIHLDRYDYSSTEYVDSHTKLNIKCMCCGNVFQQTPNMHLSGSGCPKRCYAKTTKYSTADFVKKATLVHGTKYDYSASIYVSAQTPINIKCCVCGIDFLQKPYIHLYGSGCAVCGKMVNGRYTSYTTMPKFLEKVESVHGKRYDYSKVILPEKASSTHKITIGCPQHGFFTQGFHNHLGGNGCPVCGELTRRCYKNKRTKLYYIAIDDVFKIGLTTSSVAKRYSKELKQGLHIKVIKEWTFDNGQEAQTLEQEILHRFDVFKYKGKKIIEGGYTEMFGEDILERIYTYFGTRLN